MTVHVVPTHDVKSVIRATAVREVGGGPRNTSLRGERLHCRAAGGSVSTMHSDRRDFLKAAGAAGAVAAIGASAG
ncbi:MAG TPA: twin-arginine translocation signal domain-containing protein, partial [Kofleriaceae bacterium]|nr:twin-arginine translocation signal domain-containing protein [Kofleriaceae bacterium]